MQIYQGKPVYEGIAIGRIRVYTQGRQQIKRQTVNNTDYELLRFQKAVEDAKLQLQHLHNTALMEMGAGNAAVFDMHKAILEDENYAGDITHIICQRKCNAEYAVAVTREKYLQMFGNMEDDYMRARALDVRDISERLLEALQGEEAWREDTEEPEIVVMEDMTPSELMRLNKEKILAFVLSEGSMYSHTVILAKTLGIPTIINTHIPTDSEWNGMAAVVDGEAGVIYVEPDPETISRMKVRQKELASQNDLGFCEFCEEADTGMRICANIGSLKDLELLKGKPVAGIGLLRSEFVFFEKEDFPAEEEQFEIYRTVIESMQGKPVIIRTLDMGVDKQCDYFPLEKEENPALGMRGIRVLLAHEHIFRTQLRALLRAAVFGDLGILYPMITCLEEVQKIKEIVKSEKIKLKEQGIPFGEPKQGIMIETPAAVLISDILAKEVDFFSIGTNDLTQYTLAMDRQTSRPVMEYNPHHPAILRMIKMVVENGHKEGIPVSICGELSSESALTKVFMDMGVDELSVAPGYLVPLRNKCRR